MLELVFWGGAAELEATSGCGCERFDGFWEDVALRWDVDELFPEEKEQEERDPYSAKR
jgi:hypothetical protein